MSLCKDEFFKSSSSYLILVMLLESLLRSSKKFLENEHFIICLTFLKAHSAKAHFVEPQDFVQACIKLDRGLICIDFQCRFQIYSFYPLF